MKSSLTLGNSNHDKHLPDIVSTMDNKNTVSLDVFLEDLIQILLRQSAMMLGSVALPVRKGDLRAYLKKLDIANIDNVWNTFITKTAALSEKDALELRRTTGVSEIENIVREVRETVASQKHIVQLHQKAVDLVR